MRQELAAAGFTEALNFALVKKKKKNKTQFTTTDQHELAVQISVIFVLLYHSVLPHTVLE